jgi:nicotinamide-nucleotide amidase
VLSDESAHAVRPSAVSRKLVRYTAARTYPPGFLAFLHTLAQMMTVARRVAGLLVARDTKVVFAESCTGGLVSAVLAKIPGISSHHCGGVVVYRNATKTAYLDITRALLEDLGPVSSEVAAQMAVRVLEKTPEADVAASVTGHLGPQAPPKLDGVVFVGIARRQSARREPRVVVKQLRCRKVDGRVARQRWVTERVLELLATELERHHRR